MPLAPLWPQKVGPVFFPRIVLSYGNPVIDGIRMCPDRSRGMHWRHTDTLNVQNSAGIRAVETVSRATQPKMHGQLPASAASVARSGTGGAFSGWIRDNSSSRQVRAGERRRAIPNRSEIVWFQRRSSISTRNQGEADTGQQTE